MSQIYIKTNKTQLNFQKIKNNYLRGYKLKAIIRTNDISRSEIKLQKNYN